LAEEDLAKDGSAPKKSRKRRMAVLGIVALVIAAYVGLGVYFGGCEESGEAEGSTGGAGVCVAFASE
jgi:flagellar basal body-associated protein FliL